MDVGKREDQLLDKISALLENKRHHSELVTIRLTQLRDQAPPSLHKQIDLLILDEG